MIEVEYMWRDVYHHLDVFKLGETIYINKEEYRLVSTKIQVKQGANMFLKVTYLNHDEMKGVFGIDLYDEDFLGTED